MEDPGFWDDPVVSQKKMKELKSMKDDVATYASLKTEFEDIETLIEMGYEENDASLIPEIQEMLDEFTKTYEGIRIKTLLSGEYDSDGAIVSLHAGAGGTESCDWAAMLYRMYTRWASDKGFSVEVLDSLDGEEAGIKSITFQINGENAYGYMKSEKGVIEIFIIGIVIILLIILFIIIVQISITYSGITIFQTTRINIKELLITIVLSFSIIPLDIIRKIITKKTKHNFGV